MENDPCARARAALNELCESPRAMQDSNTFYVRVIANQKDPVDEQPLDVTPQDVNEVAAAADEITDLGLFNLGVRAGRELEAQTIKRNNSQILTIFKIPVNTMTANEVQSLMEQVTEGMRSPPVSTNRDVNVIDLVDRSVVAEQIPEMLGPPIEDVERM